MAAREPWRELDAVFPGQRIFGFARGLYTYVVSFTPGFGWGASYQHKLTGRTVRLSDAGAFATRDSAEQALS